MTTSFRLLGPSARCQHQQFPKLACLTFYGISQGWGKQRTVTLLRTCIAARRGSARSALQLGRSLRNESVQQFGPNNPRYPTPPGQPPHPETAKLTSVPEPSATFLISDISYELNHPAVTYLTKNSSGWYHVGYKHNMEHPDGAANIGFMDSHVESRKKNNIDDSGMDFKKNVDADRQICFSYYKKRT